MIAFRRYALVGTVTLLVSSAMYAEMSQIQHSGRLHCVYFILLHRLLTTSWPVCKSESATFTLFYTIFCLYVASFYPLSTGQGSFVMLKYLFGTESFSHTTLRQLCLFAVYKFVATLLSVTLPLPVGLFTPTFVTGGLLGRILGI